MEVCEDDGWRCVRMMGGGAGIQWRHIYNCM